MNLPANTMDPRLLHAQRLLEEQDLGLTELGRRVGWSPAQLQRRFREAFGVSPAQYAAQRRVDTLKQALRRRDSDVTRAIYDAGFGSASRVYENGSARLGMAPLAYQRGGEGMDIRWTLVPTAIGLALVAATERGICTVALSEDAAALKTGLAKEFPKARLARVDAGRDAFLAPRVGAVAQALANLPGRVPVDLIGTAFQRRVWDTLMRVTAGQTCSYAELAKRVGKPKAVRAVALACACNRVALLVPCHRVVRTDGSLGGYRWGAARKRRLLEHEQEQACTVPYREP